MITAGRQRRIRPRAAARWALVCFLATLASAPEAAWCDLLFKDVAGDAGLIVLVEYETTKGTTATIRVVETIKGDPGTIPVAAPAELELFGPRNGDRFMMALSEGGTWIRYVHGTGACAAISVLPIRGGKLRARHRSDYDGASRSMTLEELLADLEPISTPL